jgi:hypothetical protein
MVVERDTVAEIAHLVRIRVAEADSVFDTRAWIAVFAAGRRCSIRDPGLTTPMPCNAEADAFARRSR